MSHAVAAGHWFAPERFAAKWQVLRARAQRGAASSLFCAAALLSTLNTADAQDAKILPPVEMAVACRDNVSIVCTYFPGSRGKDTTPIILLHDHKGTRRDLEQLALSLQSLLGAAVMVPDLRGHGDSHLTKVAGKATSVDNFNKLEFEAMIESDLEAIKKFLMRENNAERLNIDRLCLVGVQAGAGVATLWGVKDWRWPILTTGKQGQDVKALVLISPTPNYRGLNIATGLALPSIGAAQFRSSVAVMIVAGETDTKGKKEAEAVVALFKQGRSKDDFDRNQIDKCTLFTEFEPTKLQGTKLLSEASLNIDKKIAAFLQLRVTDRPAVWVQRSE